MTELCQGILDNHFIYAENVPCSREHNHAGKHQAFKPNLGSVPLTYMNYRWEDGDGGSVHLTSPQLWNECSHCGILILEDSVQCDDCNLEDRIHELVEKHYSGMVIFNGSIFLEEEKTKSNQGISLTVFWNDKNRKRLISSYLKNMTGPMPQKYRDALPDNAKIVETSETDIFPLAG